MLLDKSHDSPTSSLPSLSNSLIVSSFLLLDALVIFSLIDGAFGKFDDSYSFHQARGLKDGVYDFVYPALLVQFLLLEYVLDFDDRNIRVSWDLMFLMLADALAVLSLLVCVLIDADFGYYNNLSTYISIQLTTRAAPLLLAQVFVCECLVVVSRALAKVLPKDISTQQLQAPIKLKLGDAQLDLTNKDSEDSDSAG